MNHYVSVIEGQAGDTYNLKYDLLSARLLILATFHVSITPFVPKYGPRTEAVRTFVSLAKALFDNVVRHCSERRHASGPDLRGFLWNLSE